MRPLRFDQLMTRVLKEQRAQGQIFGIQEEFFFRPQDGKTAVIPFGDVLSTQVGPAAGPHSQMAPNIIAAWLCGARFIELKTVQKLDGQTIREAVRKPCILSEDEGYNCEWSTELTVEEAFDEYVKAWFALHVLQKELQIAKQTDFAFNMSVGYDLEGIKTEKIDRFIEGMKDASGSAIFRECKAWLAENLSSFRHFGAEDLEAVPARISHQITLSTLHGCPPSEIERIARYLLTEKELHTFVKCNPTLLGYDFARKTLDKLGYDYIVFDDHHFREDMQYDDCTAMIERLMPLAAGKNLAFGLKLTNTFPVDVTRSELPAEEMYMSGRSLHALTLSLACKLARQFDGKLPLAFSGGADALNLAGLLECGIGPVTMATTLLKPGGYTRLLQLAQISAAAQKDFTGIDVGKLARLTDETLNDPRYHKLAREKVGSRKTKTDLPLYDCFKAPCQEGGCPIHQQIPEYLKLVAEGKMEEAIRVIALDNTAPTITGVLCPQPCRDHCTRLDYDSSLHMRAVKKEAADCAQEKLIASIQVPELKSGKKALIIGAGPAGIAAALFLRRNGMDVEVREKEERAYGLVSQVIPAFRISDEEIDRDLKLAEAYGVRVRCGCKEAVDLAAEKQNFAYILLAMGAHEPGISPVQEGAEHVHDSMEFLRRARRTGSSGLRGKVAVAGGGDVAMDCARLLKRDPQVEDVILLYRRGIADMPAAQEDVREVLAEGIEIRPFLQPLCYDGRILKAEKTCYGPWDESGRHSVRGTGEEISLELDALVGATGARLKPERYAALGLNVDERGRAKLNGAHESSLENVYVIGDGRRGPSTIVQAIADAKTAVLDILEKEGLEADFISRSRSLSAEEAASGENLSRRGRLQPSLSPPEEGKRCLSCDLVCEICTEVCPNRANVALPLPGMKNKRQIVHIDRLCNECGNCAFFCPHAGRPYRDKWTLFSSLEDMNDSENPGWLVNQTFILRRDETGRMAEYKAEDLPAREQGLLAELERCGMLTPVR